MEDIQQALSLNIWPLLTVAIVGLVFYFVIRLIQRILFVTAGAGPLVSRVKDRWPVLERLFWALYVLGALGAFIRLNPVVGAIIAALILATTWGFLRNYVAGLIILAEGSIKMGQSVRFDSYEGKVVKLNVLNCDIELDDSGKEILKVPYFILASKLVVKTSPSENVVTQTSILEIDRKRDPLYVEGQIETTLINMPWLLAEEGFSIERLDNTDEHYRFRVVLQGIDKKQLRRGVEELKSTIEAF